MKEKKIRRILVLAILVITAISIVIKFNIKAPERENTVVAEENREGDNATDNTDDNVDNTGDMDEPVDNEGGDDNGHNSEDTGDDNEDSDSDDSGDNRGNSDDAGKDNGGDADEPDDNSDDDNEDPVNYITVYMTIDATLLADGEALRANGHENKIQYTGDNGHIATKVPVKVPENANVYDALYIFCQENDIQMEASGTAFNTAYIRGINHLYEFDGGISSGWVFLVNNVYSRTGASNVFLNEGDEIWWFYTLVFGQDVPQ
ncbi:MAG: DUF4430 domain-containing protein [Lachnospiraceae bacterium]|nr:DUF4430 domain-containing protein [Lachnospiraceae bacterium]